jgi:4-hydroxybutyrate dehydrogenase
MQPRRLDAGSEATMAHRYSFPTDILFGVGALAQLPEELARIGCRRPLLVTDPGLRAAGLLETVSRPLGEAGVACNVFEGVEPNPVLANVEDGAAAFRSGACDGVVAVGGGSALDVGKAIRLRVTHDGPLSQYDDLKGGADRIHGGMPPMIAIPTTAGTGSEVGRSAVITMADEAGTVRKTVLFSAHLMPTLALCDPELTAGLPPRLTAATGMDALTHNVEAYLSQGSHPLCDAIALEGTRLAFTHLRTATHRGTDLDARAGMMMAAIMGATAFQKGLGATHSLAHPLSSMAGVHHGLANALLLPAVLRYNQPVASARMAELARTSHLCAGAAPERGAQTLVAAVESLNRDLDLPTRLRDLGVSEEQLSSMAALAIQDGCHQLNPRPCTEADLLALYREAW